MKVITSIPALKEAIFAYKCKQTIAFVPTMGNLHQGHLDLVERAKNKADIVIVSIFVNPLQFSAGEDLESYPRTLDADIEKLSAAGVELLFVPDVTQMYAQDLSASTKVVVPVISSLWCGASRPGHFDGVTTIVNKLFNLIQPDHAVFGEKDFQQLSIIRKMVSDLNMPIEIIGVPTRRERDGLAMSSRNGYLTSNEREIAPKLRQILLNTEKDILSVTKPDFEQIAEQAAGSLNNAGFRTDYLAICRQSDLQPAAEGDRELVILVAAFLGKTRLIDNLILSL